MAQVIRQEREALLSGWRQQVRELPSARKLDIPTLNDHIPQLIEELAAQLEEGSGETIAEAACEASPPAHGMQRAEDGFDIVEVVAEYNILRGCIHDLAERHGLSMLGRSFHILNRVLDGAIGLAVQTYATQRALEVQHRREEHLAFIAHDLRTPLNAIAMAAKVLERKFVEERVSAGTAQILNMLSRNTANLGGMIAEVLKENADIETAAGVKLERALVALRPHVEDLIIELRPIAQTGDARIVNDVPEDLLVYADAGLLTRVLQNLIANAILHTPRGEIVIGARPMAAEGAAEFWIRDNGSGIAPERLQVIFDKFETDHQSESAMGLGLAIVKTFVEAHGGNISVESKLEAGSTFRITLPGQGDSRASEPRRRHAS